MVEVAQVASQSAEIASVATTCFAITLVGLAIGFVLLASRAPSWAKSKRVARDESRAHCLILCSRQTARR